MSGFIESQNNVPFIEFKEFDILISKTIGTVFALGLSVNVLNTIIEFLGVSVKQVDDAGSICIFALSNSQKHLI